MNLQINSCVPRRHIFELNLYQWCHKTQISTNKLFNIKQRFLFSVWVQKQNLVEHSDHRNEFATIKYFTEASSQNKLYDGEQSLLNVNLNNEGNEMCFIT